MAACLALTACAKPESPSTVRLVFKHGKLTGDARAMRALLNEFEQAHPGVELREEVLPASTDQQHQYYAINLDSDEVPFDILAVDVIWVAEFAKAGWILPLDHLLPSPRRDAYFPATIEAATFNDHIYAVPWYIDAGVLYYRRDLLERYGLPPPRTWSDLATAVRTILERERDPHLKGFVWPGKQYEGLLCVALEFVWGHGGSLVDAGGASEAIAALEFLRGLVRDGISPPLVSTSDEEGTRLLFGDGRAVFMRNWPYVWTLLQQEGSPVKGKIGLMPLPAFSGYETASTLGGWMLAIPRRSRHPHLAAEFVRFLASPAMQTRLARDFGYHPALREPYGDPSLLRTDPSLEDLYRVFLTAKPRPVTPYYLMLSQILQPELSAVVVGRKTPVEALASAGKQMRRLVDFEVNR
jgi:multiple sugar transport system substrate-binding protein